MKNSIYDRIVLIGFGEIYKKILKFLITAQNEWNYCFEVIEHEGYPTSRISEICGENSVEYYKLFERKELYSHLERIDAKTLIISAGNKYLFPDKLLAKDNLTIINFHNALLPKYPGRNAPSWAIYNGESFAGATWHMVNADVDAGEILWQKSCKILPDMRAYELVKQIMLLAYEGFLEIFEQLMKGTIVAVSQGLSTNNRKIYYSKDIPGNGEIKPTDSPEYIYRLLRAMDFGFNPIFPRPVLTTEAGEKFIVKRYKKILSDDADKDILGKTMFFTLNDKETLKIDLVACDTAEIQYVLSPPPVGKSIMH